ncbi:MAG TPA: prolipoprotein diacylglyceryl transferase family protein [Bacilli bacterium]|nr:prolipoprotein diacylglyceryl transferase family protein [Bacilli bacterium]
MYPTLWFIDLYTVFILIGLFMSLFVVHLYAEKIKMAQKLKLDILMIGIIAIFAGFIAAVLFQLLFDVIKGNEIRPFAMTFYGGLVGGIAAFLLLYFLYISKKHETAAFRDLLIIAPAAITIAHAFGRVGCFFAGCCYGIETNSWLGMQFPDLPNPVYPTQLFEALFLFLLFAVLFFLAFWKHNIYTMPTYLISYGVWRFLIEFIRGDERGAFFLSLSPSQWFALVAIISGTVLAVLIGKKVILSDNAKSVL